jgi:hypothetical protein
MATCRIIEGDALAVLKNTPQREHPLLRDEPALLGLA